MPQISPLSWLVLPLIFFLLFFFFLFCIWWSFFSLFLFDTKICFDGNLVFVNIFWDW